MANAYTAASDAGNSNSLKNDLPKLDFIPAGSASTYAPLYAGDDAGDNIDPVVAARMQASSDAHRENIDNLMAKAVFGMGMGKETAADGKELAAEDWKCWAPGIGDFSLTVDDDGKMYLMQRIEQESTGDKNTAHNAVTEQQEEAMRVEIDPEIQGIIQGLMDERVGSPVEGNLILNVASLGPDHMEELRQAAESIGVYDPNYDPDLYNLDKDQDRPVLSDFIEEMPDDAVTKSAMGDDPRFKATVEKAAEEVAKTAESSFAVEQPSEAPEPIPESIPEP